MFLFVAFGVLFVETCRADIIEPRDRDLTKKESQETGRSVEILGLHVGIAGKYKNGFQTPIVVFFESTESSSFEGE